MIRDPSRSRRLPDVDRVADQLWDTLVSVSIPLLILGLTFQTSQTRLVALAWRNILHAAYPAGDTRYSKIAAYYAGGNALNAILPASAGTVAMLGLFRANIKGATVAGVVGATLVENIFFGDHGRARLPVAVPGRGRGRSTCDLDWLADHRVAAIITIVGRRGADRDRRQDALAPLQAHLGERQGRRRDPRRAAALRGRGRRRRGALLHRAHGRQRDLHVRLRHPGLGRERLPDRRRRRRSRRPWPSRRAPSARRRRSPPVVLNGVAPTARSAPTRSARPSSRPPGTPSSGWCSSRTRSAGRRPARCCHRKKKDQGGDDEPPAGAADGAPAVATAGPDELATAAAEEPTS